MTRRAIPPWQTEPDKTANKITVDVRRNSGDDPHPRCTKCGGPVFDSDSAQWSDRNRCPADCPDCRKEAE